ncbi:MAG: hypothetical protein M1837_004364 [Sclerophora amabilis]|nr:MAG: hypothetical protein M1837_004364 [Sclerophora amabilis]
MTAQILSSELANLIQESKRRNPELRNAAENSLEELKSLPSTSETQLAADLSRKPNFPLPFIIACATRNAKFAAIAVPCLQRLIVSKCLSKDKLKDVLNALRETTSQGLDVQLKILQALPPLLHNYADQLQGELLGTALLVCSILQGSKNVVVNNTSAATFQQLVVSIYDKAVKEERGPTEVPIAGEVFAGEKGLLKVKPAALDAYRPEFLLFSGIPQTFGLELIESILANHADVFLSHEEQAHILRSRALPFLIRLFSEKLNFPITVRVARILNLILRRHVSILSSQCEVAFSLLTSMLDAEAASPWKRVLCMEIFRTMHSEPGLIRKFYALFDAQPGAKMVVRDHVAALVRLATEKPTVIGLGQQSTMPAGPSVPKDTSGEQAAMEAGGVGGMIGGIVSATETVTAGISMEMSSVRVVCLDQLDKPDSPTLPESYIYSLVLLCISNFSEGLAKFVLPLTISNEGRAKRKGRTFTMAEQGPPETPDSAVALAEHEDMKEQSGKRVARKSQVALNPLTLDTHPLFEEVKISSAMIETCWPAILATCSTFLNAALDNEFYHGLVRSFQRFAHVAGLLRLSTPRDAFLTTLGKAAVPPNIFSKMTSSTTPTAPNVESSSTTASPKGFLSVENVVNQPSSSSSDKVRQPHMNSGTSLLNSRNLLCLRALLNLGIALGPTLGCAWSILLDTLHQAEYIIHATGRSSTRQISISEHNSNTHGRGDSTSLQTNFGPAVAAAESAASRMFESTIDFPDQSFLDILMAVTKFLGDRKAVAEDENNEHQETSPSSARPTLLPRLSTQSHRRITSISGVTPLPTSQLGEDHFALSKLGDLIAINNSRLVGDDPSTSGWSMIVDEVVSVSNSSRTNATSRIKAAELLHGMIQNIASSIGSESDSDQGIIQERLLSALGAEIAPMVSHECRRPTSGLSTDVEVHRRALDTLKSVLEQCTETFVKGWDVVFDIVNTVFQEDTTTSDAHPEAFSYEKPSTRSIKLLRPSFGLLELICSDFLSSLPSICLLKLLDTLFLFCSQPDDLNISLTSITIFWNVSDFIQKRTQALSFEDNIITAKNGKALLDIVGGENTNDATAALWMVLLHRLKAITNDQRPEVRNGAIQTLLRTFDVYGELLSPKAWGLCLHHIIFQMMEDIAAQEPRLTIDCTSQQQDDSTAWTETVILSLNGVSELFANYLDPITQCLEFPHCWEMLLRYLTQCLGKGNLELSAAVFTCLSLILSKFVGSVRLPKESLDTVWILWIREIPLTRAEGSVSNANNQKALIAYAQVFQELYRLLGEEITEDRVLDAVKSLYTVVVRSDESGYSPDLETMNPLQTQVLKNLKSIRTDIPGVPSVIIQKTASLVALPANVARPETGKRKQTFVALSRASIDFMQSLLLQNIQDEDVYTSTSYRLALDALIALINQKYAFKSESKGSSLWVLATSTFLAVLKPSLPYFSSASIPDREIQRIWKRIVKIANGITSAQVDAIPGSSSASISTVSISTDQNFDIASFRELRDLITPRLGASLIPDKTRRLYTESLFYNSLIHTPHPKDLPQSGKEILAHLYDIRMGRTSDPSHTRRSRMSYLCLGELFSIVSRQESSPEQIRLAQAASPFLILRIGITLRTYIADQPLRGLMPPPLTQRLELLQVLRSMVTLDCEPRAIPDAPGVSSQSRKHLHRLFPLISRAVRVAARDAEVLEELGKALDAVGEEMGVA